MNERIKVLFFIESLAGGGAEKILSVIARHIDKSRFDVTVATVTAAGVHVEAVRREVGFRPMIRTRNRVFYSLIYHLIYYVLPAGWVYRMFLPHGNDVEVAFCEGFATRVIARGRAPRRIAWVHIDLEANPWTQRCVYRSIVQERRAYARFHAVVCVSARVREAFEHRFDLPARVIHNPVDSEAIRRGATEFTPLREAGVPLFVSVGRLAEQKGYDRLIPIVAGLIAGGHDLRLWILGEGPEREPLEKLVAAHNLHKFVTLWGYVENPYPYVAAADWFVCSSRSEGFSTVMTEALVLGTPVVTVECAGTRELFGRSGEWGMVVANDDGALLAAMSEILKKPQLRKHYHIQAARRGADFSISPSMVAIEDILKKTP
jgi:glycosyltransferase involved in cell wall biosynthesis